MRLFDRREAVTIQDFCRDYYNAQIFFLVDSGMHFKSPQGAAASFWQVVLEDLRNSSSSYSLVAENLMKNELTVLRLELFALAWGHVFQKDSFTVAQCIFTRDYLLQNDMAETWETMGEYNKIVARSGQFQSAERRGYFVSRDESIKRLSDAQISKARVDWFGNQVTKEADLECAARISNRIGTSANWQKSVGLSIVAAAVTERLGCELESDARDHLMFFIRMLYEGSQEAVNTVKIVLA